MTLRPIEDNGMNRVFLAAALASASFMAVALVGPTAAQTAPAARGDANGDGVLSRDEAMAQADARFDRLQFGKEFGRLIYHRALDHLMFAHRLDQCTWRNRLGIEIKFHFPPNTTEELIQRWQRHRCIRLAEFDAGAQFADLLCGLVADRPCAIGFAFEP